MSVPDTEYQKALEHIAAAKAEIERLQDALRAQLGQDKARPGDYDSAVERIVEREQDEIADANIKIDRLTTELATVKAVVDRLHKTEDGVPVVPEMELWHYCKYKDEVRKVTGHTDYRYMPSDGSCQLNIQHVGAGACHSTRELAEAAKDIKVNP